MRTPRHTTALAALLLLLVNLSRCHAQVIQLTAPLFYEMATAGNFSAIVDVRTREEWDEGHIENATFLENLQDANTEAEISTTADLDGCKNCAIVVYCLSGNRAATALEKLVLAGFQGPLFNGLGVTQWTDEGYPLVNTDSVDPPCKREDEEQTSCPTKSAAGPDLDKGTAAPTIPGGVVVIADDVTGEVNVTFPPTTDAPGTSSTADAPVTDTKLNGDSSATQQFSHFPAILVLAAALMARLH